MRPEQALDSLSGFGAGAVVVKLLSKGVASHHYLIQKQNNHYVLRIDTGIAADLELDRHTESEVLRAVARERLGPDLVVALPDKGLLVTEYLNGGSLNNEEIQSVEFLSLVAAVLKRVHAMSPAGRPLALRRRIDCYASRLDSPEVKHAVAEADALLRRVSSDRATSCLCHNDPIAANFILTGGKQLRLIDWEYAAIGDPFFDLAVVSQYHDLSSSLTETLLHSYLGVVTDADRHHLDRFRALVDRVTFVWLMAVQNSTTLTAEQLALSDRLRNRFASNPLP